MIKLFVSLPMNNKTDEEITDCYQQSVNIAKEIFPSDEIELIDSWEENELKNDFPYPSLFYLGESITKMAEADVIILTEGWEKCRGCRVEVYCALEYGIPMIDCQDKEYTIKGSNKERVNEMIKRTKESIIMGD